MRALTIGHMDVLHTSRAQGAPAELGELVQAAAGEDPYRALAAGDIDGELDAVQLSAVVAAQTPIAAGASAAFARPRRDI